MTLYYDSDENAVIENHPEGWIGLDDGRVVINFDYAPRDEKVISLLRAATKAVEGSENYEIVSEAEWEWVGE